METLWCCLPIGEVLSSCNSSSSFRPRKTERQMDITTTTTARTKTEQKKFFLLVGRSPSTPQSKRKREIGLSFSVQIVFYYLFKCWDTLSFLSNVASEDAPQQSCQCVHGTENQ